MHSARNNAALCMYARVLLTRSFVAQSASHVAFGRNMTSRHATDFLAVRISQDLSARVDNFIDRQRVELAGVRITRSDAIRMLIERGLTADICAAPDSVAA